MAKNIMNMIRAITNINKPHFQIDLDGNGVYTNYAEKAMQAIAANAPSVTLYTFDVKTGVSNVREIVMPAIRTKDSFAAAFAREWYRVQYSKATEYHNNFVNITLELTEEEKQAVKAVDERYALVRDVYNAHENYKAVVCPTVKNFVACLAKLSIKDYSADVQTAYAGLKNAYKAITKNGDTVNINKIAKDGNDENSFYARLKILIAALWTESENCIKYRFNTSKTLAHEVYQRAYVGRKLDKDGKVVRDTDINERAVLSEIVLAALEALQNKTPEAPAADDANK